MSAVARKARTTLTHDWQDLRLRAGKNCRVVMVNKTFLPGLDPRSNL
jgi:hypothetical protein